MQQKKKNQDGFVFISLWTGNCSETCTSQHSSVSELKILYHTIYEVTSFFSTPGLKKTFDPRPSTWDWDETKGSPIWRLIWEAMKWSFQCGFSHIIRKISFIMIINISLTVKTKLRFISIDPLIQRLFRTTAKQPGVVCFGRRLTVIYPLLNHIKTNPTTTTTTTQPCCEFTMWHCNISAVEQRKPAQYFHILNLLLKLHD